MSLSISRHLQIRLWPVAILVALAGCGSDRDTTELSSSSASFLKVIGNIPVENNLNGEVGIPSDLKRSFTANSGIVISRSQYILAWDLKRRAPVWTAWRLSASDIGTVGRRSTFKVDYELEQYLSEKYSQPAVQPDEFRNSCFDRGHQVPSADRTRTVEDNTATFLTSNIAPQTAWTNRVLWEGLERFTRDLATRKRHNVFIFTSPVYRSRPPMIGPNKDIPVPDSYIKIVLIRPSMTMTQTITPSDRVIVVNVPNVTSKGTNPTTDREQACKDSGHQVDTNLDFMANARWLTYLTTLSKAEASSKKNYEFLAQATPFNRSELQTIIDDLYL
jgi:endonuclease G